MKNNKYGIFMNFWVNTWEADHAYYIKKAKELGFDVLEFQAQALLNMTDARMAELKSIAKEYDVELTYSLGLDKKYDIASLDENIQKAGIEYLGEIIDRIHKMDGKILSGVSYAGWGVPEVVNVEKARENSIKNMKMLGKRAQEYGITYGIEAVNRFEGIIVNTAKQALDYVNRVDCDNVGILLDTYHMNIEEDNMGDAIRTAGSKLVGLHVGENNRTAPGNGYGHIDWKEIFQALRDVDFKGRIVAEPFVMTGGEVGDAIYVWRDLVDDTSEASIDRQAKNMLNFFKSL